MVDPSEAVGELARRRLTARRRLREHEDLLGVSALEALVALGESLRALDGDELDVVVAGSQRLARGRAKYGPLVLARDQRDFPREAWEELVDALAYVTCEVLKRARVQRVEPPDDVA